MAESLSENAAYVMGSLFSYAGKVTYFRQSSLPSPEMQAALDELATKGYLIKTENADDMPRGAVRYSLPSGSDNSHFVRAARALEARGAQPRMRHTVDK